MKGSVPVCAWGWIVASKNYYSISQTPMDRNVHLSLNVHKFELRNVFITSSCIMYLH